MILKRAMRSILAGAVAAAAAVAFAVPVAAQQKSPTQAGPSVSQSAALRSAAAVRPPGAVSGGSAERIAAVVNDDVISLSDLNGRVELILLSTGLPDTPESRKRVMPQVLRSLIDEQLQLQEARRLNISVSDQDIAAGMGRLAEQNKMSRADMEKFLGSRGVSVSSLTSQVRASLSWAKVVQRKLRPQVQIGEDEIDAELQRIQNNAGKPEYLVAEIFLATDSPEQDEEVRRLADRLVDQLRQGGSFPAMARQFSQAAGAAQGGDMGWVQQGQLPEELDSVLRQLQPGQITRPIRTLTGYHILFLRDQRTSMAGNPAEVKLALKALVLPIGGGADKQTQLARAAEISRGVDSCEALDARIKQVGGPGSGDIGNVRAGDMPPEVARLLVRMPIGKPTPPLTNDREVRLLAVCDRTMPPSSLPPRDAVYSALGQERLDMLQRRYLRDLRRAAFVEVRV